MKKLALLLCRGSGSPGFKNQEEFLDKFFEDLDKNGVPKQAIEVGFVDWYDRLEIEQRKLMARIQEKTNVKGIKLRQFLLTNISDLINYRGGQTFTSDSYHQTHSAVYKGIKELQSRVDEDTTLCIIASSMGTEIINNHIWDRQKWESKNPRQSDEFGNTPFEKMETLMGLFTIGNNIPIFASAYKLEDLRPISFPGKQLSETQKANSIWENIYDKNDPMGYPIKFINEHYAKAKTTDVEMNVGGLLSFWNLASHLKYWDSRRLRKHLALRISKIYKAL